MRRHHGDRPVDRGRNQAGKNPVVVVEGVSGGVVRIGLSYHYVVVHCGDVGIVWEVWCSDVVAVVVIVVE